MATIALYANKINQMPGLIKDVKRTVSDYKSELSTLKSKTLTINRIICNLDEVISSIQSSTKIQEQKFESLEKLSKNSEQFIVDTARVDNNVASLVNKRKNDFYEKFSYLRPSSEKSDWERFCDGIGSAVDFCKKH